MPGSERDVLQDAEQSYTENTTLLRNRGTSRAVQMNHASTMCLESFYIHEIIIVIILIIIILTDDKRGEKIYAQHFC